MRPRPHFKGGAGGQQRSSGRKLSTPGGSATTNYSMTCLERLIRTHPIWFLPKLNRDEASEFLTGKGSGVRITTVLVIIISPQYVAISSKDWGPKKVTIYFPIFYLVKSSEISYSFTCILPDYLAHEMIKEV